MPDLRLVTSFLESYTKTPLLKPTRTFKVPTFYGVHLSVTV